MNKIREAVNTTGKSEAKVIRMLARSDNGFAEKMKDDIERHKKMEAERLRMAEEAKEREGL